VTDSSLLLLINGWAGKVSFIDEFFKGISNDYFAIMCACLVLIWLWFSGRTPEERSRNQKSVIAAAISIGFTSALVGICNLYYFRPRPFIDLSGDSLNLLFYRPTDSSMPSNFASIMFAFVVPVMFYNKKFGLGLLVLALFSSFGRIYTGVHYPLDIAAGAGIAIAAGFLALGVTRLLKPFLYYLFIVLRKVKIA
jgi:undecaprenyl-diphosphatase